MDSQWIFLRPLAYVGFSLAVAGAIQLRRMYLQRRSRNWTLTHAECTWAEVVEKGHGYELRILYAYRVAGEMFHGEFRKTFSSSAMAHRWANALREKTIPVHFNPEKPALSQPWRSDLEAMVPPR